MKQIQLRFCARLVYDTQRGFSLLELLIVLVLSSAFFFAIAQLFFHQQQQYHQQQILLQTQENTRLAQHLLHQNIQSAGEIGCQSVRQPLSIYNNVTTLPLTLGLLNAYAVYGFYGHAQGWTPALPAPLAKKPSTGSDVIVIEKAAYSRAALTKPMASPSDAVHVTPHAGFEAGQIVMISDCTHADLFVVSSVAHDAQGQRLQHTRADNLTDALSYSYDIDAQVALWQVDAYYIAATSRDPSLLALFQQTLLPDSARLELVAGIHQFTVDYALLAGGAAVFARADQVTDWTLLRGVVTHVLGYAPQAEHQMTYDYFWQGNRVTPQSAGFYWPAQMNTVLYNHAR